MNTFENLLVVKIGGGEGLDVERCVYDLALLAAQRPLIVVHGVSAAMNTLCAQRGIPVRTITSPTGHTSRYTDPQTRDVFVEAANSVNADLVARLNARGIRAVGLTATGGSDGVALRGERKAAIRAVVDGRIRMIRDDYSGAIDGVNVAPLLAALAAEQVPVVPPYAVSPDGLLNVDGDRAGAALAGALGAAELVILSNVRGLYRSYPDESSFVPRVEQRELERALGWAQGRMKRKVLGAQEALENGVRRVVIADGRSENPVTQALGGMGTEFVA